MNKINNLLTENFYLVITEYPRSGGTWLTTLLGETLDIPKRDIYVTNENVAQKPTSKNIFKKIWFRVKNFGKKENIFFNYGIFNHFWYKDAKSLEIKSPSVIKSHELPNSSLIRFDAHYLHLMRDGRDVVVSKYFYEKDFCLKNGFIKSFDTSFEDYIRITAEEWKKYVNAWATTNTSYIKYEDLLLNPKETVNKIITDLNLSASEEHIASIIENNEKDRFSQKLGGIVKHNTVVRKAISGDWKNHFTDEHKRIFKEIAGDTLIQLGYEQDTSW
jgi:hypothetical protein